MAFLYTHILNSSEKISDFLSSRIKFHTFKTLTTVIQFKDTNITYLSGLNFILYLKNNSSQDKICNKFHQMGCKVEEFNVRYEYEYNFDNRKKKFKYEDTSKIHKTHCYTCGSYKTLIFFCLLCHTSV